MRGKILIDESLELSERFGIPLTVWVINGERWAFPAVSGAKECPVCED